MSRTALRDQRLRLYRLGNTKCPICLKPFTEQDAEDGSFTLEHVPPQRLCGGSVGMCLTCEECNSKAGKGVDQAAIDLARQVPTKSIKVRVDVPGTPPLTGQWSPGSILVRGRRGVEPKLGPNLKFQARFTLPQPGFASVSYLKSAYLSVFSLLGPRGYMYAEDEALVRVRQQIMNPTEEVIEKFACKPGADINIDGSAIIMDQQRQCWAVKICDCIVLLPSAGDEYFYHNSALVRSAGYGTCQGPLWWLAKFGQVGRRGATFKRGFDVRAYFGIDNLFGKEAKVVSKNGRERHYLVANQRGLEVAFVQMPR